MPRMAPLGDISHFNFATHERHREVEAEIMVGAELVMKLSHTGLDLQLARNDSAWPSSHQKLTR